MDLHITSVHRQLVRRMSLLVIFAWHYCLASLVTGLSSPLRPSPLTQSVLSLPLDDQDQDRYSYQYHPDVVYTQKDIGTRIQGLTALQQACQQWEREFVDGQDEQVQSTIGRIARVDAQTLRVYWNVTWVPVTATWLQTLPARQQYYVPYTHLSQRIHTFSWTAVGHLLTTYVTTATLRIPLACIEGHSDITVLQQDKHHHHQEDDVQTQCIVRIDEELVYAAELKRGALQNRKCADDLRLFLEVARRYETSNVWYDTVARALPWSDVPGSNPLDVDQTEEGPMAAAIFCAIVGVTILAAADVMASAFIGQALCGPTNYIVSPDDFFTNLVLISKTVQ